MSAPSLETIEPRQLDPEWLESIVRLLWRAESLSQKDYHAGGFDGINHWADLRECWPLVEYVVYLRRQERVAGNADAKGRSQ